MARAIWSGVITFGMVSIPVRLFPATQDKDISFHLLHKPVDPMALRAMFHQAVKPVPRAVVRKLPDPEESRPDATSP